MTATLAGVTSAKLRFSIAGKKSRTLKLRQKSRQLQALQDASGNHRLVRVKLSSSKPARGSTSARRSVRVTPPLRVVDMATEATKTGGASVTLSCASTKTCVGSASVTVGGKSSSATKVAVSSKRMKSFTLLLSAAQRQLLTAAKGPLGARISVRLSAPFAVTATGRGTLRAAGTAEPEQPGGGDGGHHGGDTLYSHAYTNSWKPSEYDTCTAEEHNSYAVTGPDGKLYPGWHPAVHTRPDGSKCSFGHEHGDDPRASNLYSWVLEKYREQNPDADGLPFGYGSEQLSEYVEANPNAPAAQRVHRHEDDPGHKVIVSNNQVMRYQNTDVTFTDKYGEQQTLVCDFLINAHQGSHSSDATKNNTHELIYAAKCNDRTEIFVTVMTNYGNANELHASCTRQFSSGQPAAQAIPTVGSELPAGEGGKRLIPTLDCVNQYTTNGSGVYGVNDFGMGTTDDRRGSPNGANGWWWAGYEQWQSFTRITSANGTELARFEPWFGIQNPSRYYVSNGGVKADGTPDTTVGYFSDLAWQQGKHAGWQPWASMRAQHAQPIDRRDPDAWFNGAIRDAWLTTPLLANSGSANDMYVDPWGKRAQATPFPGAIRIYLARKDNRSYVTTTTPTAVSRATLGAEALTRQGATAPKRLNFFYDYGAALNGDSLGVHAPN
ncbi:MAG: hypothetical protein J0H64_08655 [Actinobacteria bacterium]|nr:hypothetical protein [Actinomycetota bacterium]